MLPLLIFLLLSSAAGAQVLVKTVCESGCDYTTAAVDFQRALNEAASYQEQGPSNCLDYIIEVDASAKIVGNFTIPNKSCQAFVTIRSNRMDALPGRGTRIDPSVHAEFMPTFEAARVAGSSSPVFATVKNGGTRYWRFTGLNVYAGDSLYAYKIADPGSGAGTIQVDPTTLPGTLTGDWKVTCTSGPCENGSGTFTVSDASNRAAGTAVQGTPFERFLQFTITDISSPIPQGAGWMIRTIGPLGLMWFGTGIWGDSDTDADKVPSHIEIERCWIHGPANFDFPRQGIRLDVRNGTVEDSWIDEIHEDRGDSQGILLINAPGPVYVRNNYIAAAGQALMTGGTVPNIRGIVPSGTHIVGNWLQRPYSWWVRGKDSNPSPPCFPDAYWRNTVSGEEFICSADGTAWNATGVSQYPSRIGYFIKPHLECKNCIGYYVFANYMSHGWLPYNGWGGPKEQWHNFVLLNQVDNAYSSLGGAEHTRPQSVYIHANRGEQGGSFLTISNYGSGYWVPTNDVVAEHNLLTNMGDSRIVADGQPLGRSFSFGVQSRDIQINHNTVHLAPGGVSSYMAFVPGADMVHGYVGVQNNIFPHGNYGFYIEGHTNGGCALQKGVASDGSWSFSGNILTAETQPGTIVNGDLCASQYTYPPGNQFASRAADVVDPANGYRVRSSYTGAGTDQTDPGADINLVEAYTARAQDGQLHPLLDFRLRSVLPSSTGATIYYTAPSDDACTFEISTSPGFQPPVGNFTQERTGRDAQVNVTDLLPSTDYMYRVVCGSNSLHSNFRTDP